MHSMTLYGRALFDYYIGNFSNKLYMCRDDGFKLELPVDVFFRDTVDFEIDQKALNLCFGTILDIGAGTGLHSLYLQKLGLSVKSLDISEEVCLIIKKRGVKDVVCSDILEYSGEKFDTILILGRGIGAIGCVENIPLYLRHFRELLKMNGQIVLNSFDLRRSTISTELEYVNRNLELGRYFGEITYHFEYNGEKGKEFKWVQIDKETIIRYICNEGFAYQIIHEEEGNYLVRIY